MDRDTIHMTLGEFPLQGTMAYGRTDRRIETISFRDNTIIQFGDTSIECYDQQNVDISEYGLVVGENGELPFTIHIEEPAQPTEA